ncbi:MAG: Hpt domain-containing protein [Acidimicrobiia bacterium]|nr:Hpt domain-containing protein [Acidimicrobiia bacterium]NNC74870.1 Hpt domain-containing protein [Acidimicrobiia bacterium]
MEPVTTLVFNEESALAVVGGDREFLGTILGIFLEELPKAIETIDSAVANDDDDAVQKAAHKLKGEAGAIGAEAVAVAAKDLNDSARDRNIAAFSDQWAALRAEIERLIPVIQPYTG